MKKIPIERELLVSLYLGNLLSQNEIAEQLNVSRALIHSKEGLGLDTQ